MNKKISGVYKITNKITGDCYVGSSKNILSRWYNHKAPSTWKRLSNNRMYQDMQKYGLDNFNFEIIVPAAPDCLKKCEQEFIDIFKPTYNNNNAYIGLDISVKEDFNEYHRQYLQNNKKYNTDHTEYCREWAKNNREYFKQWYQKNKEKIAEQRKNRKEKIAETQKKYRKTHKTEISEFRKQYYQKNREKILEKCKQRYQQNKANKEEK